MFIGDFEAGQTACKRAVSRMSGHRGRTSQPRYDRETRAQALALADEHGAEGASRRTGIAAGTIRRWRHEAGRVTAPRGVDAARWAERKRAAADETWAAAHAALARVRELLARGDGRSERDAKDAALTLAILLDKSAALEEAGDRAAERSARFAAAQIDALAQALSGTLDDLRLPRTPEVMAVIAHHLRPLEDPDAPTGPAPTASVAAEALRAAVCEEASPERDDGPLLALPVGDEEHVSGEVVDVAPELPGATDNESWDEGAGPRQIGY